MQVDSSSQERGRQKTAVDTRDKTMQYQLIFQNVISPKTGKNLYVTEMWRFYAALQANLWVKRHDLRRAGLALGLGAWGARAGVCTGRRCRRAASVGGASAPGGTAGKAGGRAGAIGVWGTQRCERGLGGGARPAAAAIGGKVLAVPQHLREPWAERVAIMVMDGGLPREEAERLAWNWLQAPRREVHAAATAHTLRVTVCSGAV